MSIVEFYWDAGSPYTYLAATQIDALRARTGATIVMKPFLIGGLFKAIGNTMPAALVQKAVYMQADLRRWADRYRVPIRVPGKDDITFPLNTLLTMRVAMAAELAGDGAPYATAIMAAYWGEGRDVSDPGVIADVLAKTGLDAALLERANAQPVKDALRANTEAATERGAFGAPTFFVGDEMYWGNDRLDFLEEKLTS